MTALSTHRDFQNVQKLPFCYICGSSFRSDERRNRDHIPAQAVFKSDDKKQVLWLPTHYSCNTGHKLVDEKIGQLISLKHGKVPKKENRRLKIRQFGIGSGAIDNLDIRGTVWSWIRGFHAALYREPLPPNLTSYGIETPLPSGKPTQSGFEIDPLLQQHKLFVETIKTQRVKSNLDSIKAYNSKLTYECVWHQCDNNGPWLCIFALDLYNWKDLGYEGAAARGCAGFYQVPSCAPPAVATRTVECKIIIPNVDVLDAFFRVDVFF